MKTPPFRLILVFREQKFCLPPDPPSLQTFTAICMLFIMLVKVPYDFAPSIPTNPLPVQVYVDINVETTFDIYSNI